MTQVRMHNLIQRGLTTFNLLPTALTHSINSDKQMLSYSLAKQVPLESPLSITVQQVQLYHCHSVATPQVAQLQKYARFVVKFMLSAQVYRNMSKKSTAHNLPKSHRVIYSATNVN